MKKVTQIIRKALVFALLAYMAVPMVFAAEEKECLVVHLKDNSTVSYFLEDTPVVTYVGTDVHIESADLQANHAIADVVMLNFEMKEKIKDAVDKVECRITIENNMVIIEGLNAGIKVSLFDIQGRILRSLNVGADGVAEMNIDSLNAGIYVVATSDGRSFKVLKH